MESPLWNYLPYLASPHIVLAVIVITVLSYYYRSTPKGLPPGPIGLPLFGYGPFLGKTPSNTITKLGQKYGSVFSFYLGNRLVVVLHDYEAIHEAFVTKGDIFKGRPDELRNTFTEQNTPNMVASEGEFWKDHRRFALVLMRDCGVGKLSCEPRMMEEIHHCLNELKNLNGEATDMRRMLNISIANNISIVALGKRYDYDDQEFLKFTLDIDALFKTSSNTSTITFLPWLRYVFGFQIRKQHSRLRALINQVDHFLNKTADEHKANHVNDQRSHYVDAFLTEQNARLKMSNGKDEIFTDRILINNMRALMGAGIDTTLTTLLWGIIYMIRHPDVQRKVQKELDEVIGSERSPSWNDRVRTPFTEATICEIQRQANLVPLNLPRSNTSDTELMGYKIPSRSFILSNLGHVLSDPKLWGDPENFRPERFLNDQGEVNKPPYFIPFSTGKRQCLGEILAKMELYLYFASMLQKFSFQSSDGTLPSLESEIQLTNYPKFTMARAVLRQ